MRPSQRRPETVRRAPRAEARRREVERQNSAHLEEQRLAQLRGGIPADDTPDGVTAVQMMMQREPDDDPRRTSVLEDALTGGGIVYGSLRDEAAT